MMRKQSVFIILFSLLFIFDNSFAQEKYNSSGRKGDANYTPNRQKSGFDPNRLILGGGFDGGGGSGIFALGVSPLVGYRVTNHFSAGVQLGYQYMWVKNGQWAMDGNSGQILYKNLNYHIVSPGVWARMLLFSNVFLMTQYEHNIYSYKGYVTSTSGLTARRQWDKSASLLLGAGLRQPISNNSSFVIMAFYDVLQNIKYNQRIDAQGNTYSISPYANTIGFKVGFNLGF